jgi:hypothetical protein
MAREGKPNSLTVILEGLPPETPFFVPDEILVLWFPPWMKAGSSIQYASHLLKRPEHCSAALFPMTLLGSFGALPRRQIQIRAP